MTIDEAIKHAEEVVKEKLYEYQECIAVHDMEDAMNCEKCGEEHRQIAEWLKELKQLREQTRWIPVDTSPKQSERYLAQTSYNSMCVLGYAKNLYEVDKFDFCDDKGKSGWYDYDSEYGYYEIDDVVAWMPLPKLYKVESKR